jgi:putative addiction module component (TIGR02574 family)
MRKPLDELLAQALRLDPKDRAELASELLGSLDGPEDLDAQAAWEDDIQRRVAALEAGTLRLEPWEAVKIRIEKTLRKR